MMEHFWPLFEEVKPKLGKYEPLAELAQDIAEKVFDFAGQNRNGSVVIHRQVCQKLNKALEILEYVGFIVKREASRAVIGGGGGRGPRYVLNAATLLDSTQNKRLSKELLDRWLTEQGDIAYIGANSELLNLPLPDLPEMAELSVFSLGVDSLKKSKVYPYGLTDDKCTKLANAGFNTIGNLAAARDDEIDRIKGIGSAWVDRVRAVVAQAVWM
jgi:hypothetical protein